jgi:hypothetical protein
MINPDFWQAIPTISARFDYILEVALNLRTQWLDLYQPARRETRLKEAQYKFYPVFADKWSPIQALLIALPGKPELSHYLSYQWSHEQNYEAWIDHCKHVLYPSPPSPPPEVEQQQQDEGQQVSNQEPPPKGEDFLVCDGTGIVAPFGKYREFLLHQQEILKDVDEKRFDNWKGPIIRDPSGKAMFSLQRASPDPPLLSPEDLENADNQVDPEPTDPLPQWDRSWEQVMEDLYPDRPLGEIEPVDLDRLRDLSA